MSDSETAPTPTPTYEEKRAKQRTRREEKAQKRAYLFLSGRIRSELRRQLDRLYKPNVNDFIEALAQGKGLKVHIELIEQTPPVTVPEKTPLIVVP